MTYVPLFQEQKTLDPFWMLVACSLVNLTTWEEARPVLRGLRDEYGDPPGLGAADVGRLSRQLRSLGLHNRRARTLRAMAQAWCVATPRTADDVMKLPGCGQYAADSWAIFVEGRRDVAPTDRRLREYLEKIKSLQCGRSRVGSRMQSQSNVVPLLRERTMSKKSKSEKKPSSKKSNNKAPKVHRITVSSYMRDLIKEGKSNKEVWEASVKEFKHLDEGKKYYPAWYRGEMRRKGLIPAEAH